MSEIVLAKGYPLSDFVMAPLQQMATGGFRYKAQVPRPQQIFAQSCLFSRTCRKPGSSVAPSPGPGFNVSVRACKTTTRPGEKSILTAGQIQSPRCQGVPAENGTFGHHPDLSVAPNGAESMLPWSAGVQLADTACSRGFDDDCAVLQVARFSIAANAFHGRNNSIHTGNGAIPLVHCPLPKLLRCPAAFVLKLATERLVEDGLPCQT